MKPLWVASFCLAGCLAVGAQTVSSTFTKDIAPIIFQHCASCHRPGQSGPFSLLNYADVQKRARQIAEVTARRYMPPWLPESDQGEFLGDRRLSDSQIQLLQLWFKAGTPEGAANNLPPMPKWTEGWQMGTPDFIVQMPSKYTLPAEGFDVYRNFVIPAPLTSARHVRAIEFRPDNRRIVHHAFIKVDQTGNARRLDGTDGQPGFAGMNLPDGVKMPSGYILSWQPGKAPTSEPPGFGWTLAPGQDLVLQSHLKPTGKPEELQAQLGLYFTDIPPTNATFTFSLSSLSIEIAPGTNDYLVEDSIVLPVDVEIMSILPHAHYLGKRLEGLAILPDGKQQLLIRIPDWDFNWQGDYRYASPVALPAGSKVQMRFSYDNSASNPRNPNQPPKLVRYGSQSTDEMAELWFQVRLAGTNEAARLARTYAEAVNQRFVNYAEFRLQRNPHDANARTELGFLQLTHQQPVAAMESFLTAARDDPAYDQPHYYLGLIHRTQGRLTEARAEFETATRLNPKNAKAFGNLGFIFLEQHDLARAESSFAEALRLNPADQLAHDALNDLERARKDRSKSP